jgi:putative ABC transport system permease protein
VWLQNQLTSRFSNISLIDVALVIEKIMQLLKQMSWALQVMALLSIGVGFFVLYSLIQHQMGQRKKDLSLLKALGLNFKDLNRMVLIEFFLLSGLAGFIGGSASMLVTYVFSALFFDGVWSFDLWTPTFLWICLTSLCLLVSHFAARRTLKVKAQELLQEVF